jgi:hypothetical protein
LAAGAKKQQFAVVTNMSQDKDEGQHELQAPLYRARGGASSA